MSLKVFLVSALINSLACLAFGFHMLLVVSDPAAILKGSLIAMFFGWQVLLVSSLAHTYWIGRMRK